MYTSFRNSNVELCNEVSKVDTLKIAKIGPLEKTFTSLDLRISKNIL